MVHRVTTALLAAALLLSVGGARVAAQADPPTDPAGARRLLISARYKEAVKAYDLLVKARPGDGEGHYGLVAALVGAHRSQDASTAAARALTAAPQTAGALAAAGLAAFRRAELSIAERHFREALRLDPRHAGASKGLAAIDEMFSRRRSARNLLLDAYAWSPDDPALIRAFADTQTGTSRVRTLEEAYAGLDPESEEAQGLAMEIDVVRASLDRELDRLTSPYAATTIPLRDLEGGHGVLRPGVRVVLNGGHRATLLLDTGASGVSLSPRLARKAGLVRLGEKTAPVKGIGRGKPYQAAMYLAAELKVGEVAFADVPVGVFPVSDAGGMDGILGADVFRQFLVTLDFPRRRIVLAPHPEGPHLPDPPGDSPEPSPGFDRVMRFGNHLATLGSINRGVSLPYLLDSGAALTLMDEANGRTVAMVMSGAGPMVYGVQGLAPSSTARGVQLTFMGFTQFNVSLTTLDLESMSDDFGVRFGGIIGMPVLVQAAMTIDYRHANVKLETRGSR